MSNTESDNRDNKRKTRIDSIELNPRQKMFVENYLFNGNNGTKAYMVAYENDNERSSAVRASELLKREKISKEIDRRQAEIKEHNLTYIATGEEILQFYTQVMINPDNKLDHRMKAGEYLGKSMGLFIERHEVNQTTDFQINLGFDAADDRKIIEHQATEFIDHEDE
ncbi:terminase small subunit [Sporosarcina beigongshangi]|uniref:terminase small subunit n=1 Tax=Sporosarcina beigongshangi TaxID=2782538 RepID=UPI001939D25D|nr:terminase small subunit [Sporosarcina beigongshangi]